MQEYRSGPVTAIGLRCAARLAIPCSSVARPLDPRRLYLGVLKHAAPQAVDVLRKECGLGRRAAAEAFAAMAGMGLAGLARHQRDRKSVV